MTRLDDARGVGGRGVAVDPALRVDDVADGVVGAADRESGGLQSFFKRLDVGRVVQQELDVVAAGEAQMAAAVLVGQVREQADASGCSAGAASPPARCRSCRPIRRRGRARPGASDLVVLPLAVVLLDHRVQELLVVRRADIGDSLYGLSCHGLISSLCLTCTPLSPSFWKKM